VISGLISIVVEIKSFFSTSFFYFGKELGKFLDDFAPYSSFMHKGAGRKFSGGGGPKYQWWLGDREYISGFFFS
jgi:hypothetical protein